MLHPLDLYDRLVRRRFQHHVVAAGAGMFGIDRPTQCIRPKSCGRVHIGSLAVNEQGAEVESGAFEVLEFA